MQHNNLYNDNSKSYTNSVPISNVSNAYQFYSWIYKYLIVSILTFICVSIKQGTRPLNGKSNTKVEQKHPLTSSCSSLESTYSSSSVGYTSKPVSINSVSHFKFYLFNINILYKSSYYSNIFTFVDIRVDIY